MTPWLANFVATCAARLQAQGPGHLASRYLASRGVEAPAVRAYQLGWLPDPHEIELCTPEFWEWIKRHGWEKLVFPLTDPLGTVVGVQLRSPHEKGYRDFLAVPTELCPLAFGLHVALPTAFQTRRLVLVEGVFDYFALAPYAPDTVAMLTSTASLSMRRLISRYAVLVVCLTDMDAPGRRGAYKLAGLPIPVEYARPKDITNRVPKPPPYQVVFPMYTEHDPADLWKAGKLDELQRLAATGALPLYKDQEWISV